MVIQHNMQAMFSNRELGITTYNKAKSQEKLSSGYKINRAADDAAGLTISEGMRRQIRGLTQGVKNAQDGVSMCQIADGALEEVNDMLHRITELSVKSANGTNTAQDRQAIQSEINELLCEIDRVSESTTFNENKIFAQKPDILNQITDKPDFKQSAEEQAYVRRRTIQDSLSAQGLASINLPAVSTISAATDKITINGTDISYNNVTNENGEPINENPLKEGQYTFSYQNMEFSFSVPTKSTLSDVIAALDGTKFRDAPSFGDSITLINISNIHISPTGRYANEYVDSGCSLYVSENGLRMVSGKILDPAHNIYGIDKTITWADLGIDDIYTAQGKSFEFYEGLSGLSFTGTFNSDYTREDITSSQGLLSIPRIVINDRSTGAVLQTGIPAYNSYNASPVTVQGKLGQNISNVDGLASVTVSSGSHSGEIQLLNIDKYVSSWFVEWERMGHSKLDQYSDMNMTAELLSDEEGNPFIRITDKATGNYLDNELSYINDQSMGASSSVGYMTFGKSIGQGGNSIFITLAIKKPVGVSLESGPQKRILMNYLGSLGTIASNITVKSLHSFETEEPFYRRKIEDKISFIPSDLPLPKEYNNPTWTEKGINSFWIQSGDSKGNGIWLKFREMNAETLGIDKVDVSTESGAREAISTVEKGLDRLLTIRSEIGAQQNRLEHTIDNENNIVENTTAAESRIRDADMATEMMKFSKESILQQAGQAMLAQANQSQQGIMVLLQR